MCSVRKLWAVLGLVPLLALSSLLLWSASATGYPEYRSETGGTPSCYSCHNGFFDRGTLHTRHVGSTKMTNTCTLCHTNTGDIPKLDSSGTDPAHACNGCHVGPGLRLHHAAAGAPADADGLVCADCHAADPASPAGESTVPPYYSRSDVNVKYPCGVASASGGEDWNGNGFGLDNDGDLVYDQTDPDCGPLPARTATWGFVKSVYR